MLTDKYKEFIRMLVIFTCVGFTTLLNESLMNVAFPILAKEFAVPVTTIQWLTTGFMLVMGICMPMTAFVLKKFPLHKVLIFAISVFLIGTILGGSAVNFPMLISGRLIQAAGTAFFVPMTMNVVLLMALRDKIGYYNGFIGLVLMAAPALGPVLSGYLLDLLNWRWLFFILVPLPLGCLILAKFLVKDVIENTNPRLDFMSALPSLLAFGGIIFGVGNVGNYGFTAPLVYLPLFVGLVSFFIFVRRQLQLPVPLLDLRIMAVPQYRFGILLAISASFTLFGWILVIPLYIQVALGYSTITAGLVLLPGGIVNCLMSLLAGRMFDRFRIRFVPLGYFLASFAFAALLWGTFTAMPVIGFVLVNILFNLGLPMAINPLQTFALVSLQPDQYPHGTAFNSTLFQIFGALGTAIFVTIIYAVPYTPWQKATTEIAAFVGGTQIALMFGILVLLVLGAIALFKGRTLMRQS